MAVRPEPQVDEVEALGQLRVVGRGRLIEVGLAATLRELGEVEVREGAPPSPDDGLIADYRGEVGNPAELAARLAATPGVVDHGLFEAGMVDDVIIGRGSGAERI